MSAGVWEVVGGTDKGGILVRTGKDLKSPESKDGRLTTGSIVAQLALEGDRLRYTLVEGGGPSDGWVSLKAGGRELLAQAGKEGTKRFAAEQLRKQAETWVAPEHPEVCFVLQGTRGDVQPVLGLCISLRERGVMSTILGPPNFQQFIEAQGIHFVELGTDFQQKADEQTKQADENMRLGIQTEDQEAIEKEWMKDPTAFEIKSVIEHYAKEEYQQEVAKQFLDQLEKRRPSVIIQVQLGGMIPVAFLAWQKHRIPVMYLEYFPTMVLDPKYFELSRALVGFSWDKLQEFNEMMKKSVGIGPFDGLDTDEDYFRWRTSDHDIIAVHPDILDLTPKEHKHYLPGRAEFCTGFIRMSLASQMSTLKMFGGIGQLQQIQTFLDEGTPPVYIGWGSMIMPAFCAIKAILNLRVNRMRGILMAGWANLDYERLSGFVEQVSPGDAMGIMPWIRKNVLCIQVAPHEWLFPRCLFLIHHGGAGTTAAAIRAGVPSLITPFFMDQPWWGKWVVERNIGDCIDWKENVMRFTDPVWSKSFRKLGSDKEIRANVLKYKKMLDEMDGNATACDHIQRVLKEEKIEKIGFSGKLVESA